MSSPFNPLTALTPGLHHTPGLHPTPGGLGASPSVPVHPFLLPGSSPSPGLLALYSAPQALGTPQHVPGLSVPVPLPQAASATPQSEADDTLRALPDALRLLERAEAVRAELTALEGSVFTSGEGAERAASGLSRLEALQLDYAQTLLALIQVAGTYLVGALPVPLSAAAAPAPASAGEGGAAPTPAPTSGVGAFPTPAQLAAWDEARAAAAFGRREGVKTASRAVVDVLRGSSGR
ncbi:hypothetical protein Q8F55_004143 [Vanrija albida]|uniref:Mediator of RNA polymerase II transcription subunit 11 n=1 Tax=Vanrija albida TaxID=181172 RepID=A0ABR3Q5X9_9TREE